MPSERLQKVEQAIKEEVAQILQQEIKDPRIGFVTVTRVKISPDLHQATIYFSLLETLGNLKETEAGLKSAAGYVRKLLGERLRIRVTPEVHFRADPSIAESIRMSKLIDALKPQEQEQEKEKNENAE